MTKTNEKPCRKCRFNVRGSDVCRITDRPCKYERTGSKLMALVLGHCGAAGRWWQPKIARRRKIAVVPDPAKEGGGNEL